MNQKHLKEILHYEPETGIFTWVKSEQPFRNGRVAGSLSGNGYFMISISHKRHYTHRLAFLYMAGSIPKYVDHIDMDRKNNKWSNLRQASSSQNHANYKKHKDSKSKYKGVSYSDIKEKDGRPWYSRIMKNYKKYHLGYFKTELEAAQAYNKKAIELFGDFANVNKLT